MYFTSLLCNTIRPLTAGCTQADGGRALRGLPKSRIPVILGQPADADALLIMVRSRSDSFTICLRGLTDFSYYVLVTRNPDSLDNFPGSAGSHPWCQVHPLGIDR